MFLQKDSLPIVSGMYATAHRITDTTSIYYSGFLLTWFRWKNSYSCLTVSNITLKVLLNVDHLKTHNMRLKTVRKKSKLSTRSFRNEKTKKTTTRRKSFQLKLQQSENQNVMLKYWEKFADGLDIAYCIKANVWRPVPKLCKYVGSSTSEQLKSIRFLLCLDIRYVNTVWNVKMRSMSEVKYVLVSMTSLLTHTVAHSTRPSCLNLQSAH